jgi:prepilin peptidase CpaA
MPALLLVHLLSLALLMGLLLAAAVGDIKTFRIPNAYSIALAALFPVFALTAPYAVPVLASLGVAALVLAVGFAGFAARAVGGGDVKLLSAAALFAGPSLILEFVLITTLSGGLVSLVMMHRPMRLGIAFALDQVGSRTLRDLVMADDIPYGVAIAAGGTYLTLRLVGLATDAVP